MISDRETNVSSLRIFGDEPFFVFCDHASNAIDDDLDCLGMPEDLLATHIAWDIGAGGITRAVGERLSCATLNCKFSRLVVDANRAVEAPDVIPATSDQIPVPGNQMLDEAARQARFARYHDPYHEELGAVIEALSAKHDNLFTISIHSFTDRMMGAADPRPWQAGMLWRHDETSARMLTKFLKSETDWQIGDNEPYDARVFNYSVDRHIAPKHLRHITLELRQDVIFEERDRLAVADLLARGFRHVTERL